MSDERVQRYVEACQPWEAFTASDGNRSVGMRTPEEIARAVMAVADAEQDEIVALARAQSQILRERAEAAEAKVALAVELAGLARYHAMHAGVSKGDRSRIAELCDHIDGKSAPTAEELVQGMVEALSWREAERILRED